MVHIIWIRNFWYSASKSCEQVWYENRDGGGESAYHRQLRYTRACSIFEHGASDIQERNMNHLNIFESHIFLKPSFEGYRFHPGLLEVWKTI